MEETKQPQFIPMINHWVFLDGIIRRREAMCAKIEKEKRTCNDCKFAGELVESHDEFEPLKKYCPPEYMWNHPNPEKCPHFVMRE